MTKDLLSVNDAKAKIIGTLAPVGITELGIADAGGRILAESIDATIDSPSFTNSSMDGFAIQASDIVSSTKDAPVKLKVIGDIPAGISPTESVASGEAMRIMTGAMLPDGADCVIPVEATDHDYQEENSSLPESIRIYKKLNSGDYVRNKGEDFKKGENLIRSGNIIRSQDIAIFAMLGVSKVKVRKKPRVAIISTGDELISVESDLEPGKIRETNSYMLTELIKSCGAEIINLGVVADNKKDVKATFDKALLEEIDLIISTAGVSVGAYDYVKNVVEENGDLDFWRVNMRPGKPLAFGKYNNIPYVGLPGNPVSSFVGFEVFLRPAINHLAGNENWKRHALKAILSERVFSDGRESYLRAKLVAENGELNALFSEHQGSGNLYSLVNSNGLIIIPATIKIMEQGDIVEAWLL
ncbi:MAG: molybdopterin molybdotransferase MoeA [Chloroflexota bacterium]